MSYTGPCPAVSLSHVDWTGSHATIKVPSHCGDQPWNPVLHALTAAFAATTIWIDVDLILQLLYRFKKWTTLYFWSIMITACGTIIVALGELVVRFTGAPKAGLILGGTGRAPMLTGFALVLYSRLHLVVRNRRLLNMAIILVVLVAILLDPPTIAEGVLPNDQTVGLQVIRYFEILYAVEETALASIYIYGFWSFTKGARSESRTRKTFRLLIAAEAFIVAMHIIVMTVALLGLALAKLIILHFSYALKLKVEFILLNSLVEWSKNMNTRDPPSDSVQPLSADVEKGVARPQVTQDQVSQPWRKFEQYPAAPRGANTRTAQMILNPPSCERCDPVKELAQEGGSLQIQRASCSCYDLELENKRTGDEDTL